MMSVMIKKKMTHRKGLNQLAHSAIMASVEKTDTMRVEDKIKIPKLYLKPGTPISDISG